MIQENLIIRRQWFVEQQKAGYWNKFFAWRAGIKRREKCLTPIEFIEKWLPDFVELVKNAKEIDTIPIITIGDSK